MKSSGCEVQAVARQQLRRIAKHKLIVVRHCAVVAHAILALVVVTADAHVVRVEWCAQRLGRLT